MLFYKIMNHSNQNTASLTSFSTKEVTLYFGITTIITTLWGC